MRSLHVLNEERQRIYATWQRRVVMHQPHRESHCHYRSSSSAGAQHQPSLVFGAKRDGKKKQCLCKRAHIWVCVQLCLLLICVCVCLSPQHPYWTVVWRWMHFPGCPEFKRKHPSWRNTVSQVETEGLSPASDRGREEETEVADRGVCGPTSPIMSPLDKFH